MTKTSQNRTKLGKGQTEVAKYSSLLEISKETTHPETGKFMKICQKDRNCKRAGACRAQGMQWSQGCADINMVKNVQNGGQLYKTVETMVDIAILQKPSLDNILHQAK